MGTILRKEHKWDCYYFYITKQAKTQFPTPTRNSPLYLSCLLVSIRHNWNYKRLKKKITRKFKNRTQNNLVSFLFYNKIIFRSNTLFSHYGALCLNFLLKIRTEKTGIYLFKVTCEVIEQNLPIFQQQLYIILLFP